VNLLLTIPKGPNKEGELSLSIAKVMKAASSDHPASPELIFLLCPMLQILTLVDGYDLNGSNWANKLPKKTSLLFAIKLGVKLRVESLMTSVSPMK